MNLTAATTGLSPATSDLYRSEVRFGVVMYGVVSLAIYINGVANELYEMGCATPKVPEKKVVSGTRDVYRKASLLLGSEQLRQSYAAHLSDPTQPDPFAALGSPGTSRPTRLHRPRRGMGREAGGAPAVASYAAVSGP